MSTSPATVYDPPIIAADGNQVITIDNSVSFQWIPAAGNSYVSDISSFDWDTGSQTPSVHSTSVSTATGYVTFDGVTSSEPFSMTPTEGSFAGVAVNITLNPQSLYGAWTYDPATGVLNPNGASIAWDDVIWVSFQANEVDGGWYHWDTNGSDEDYGHWQLVPDIHNVDVFGGVGNDTILGGQGTERLFGGTGNDLIRAGVGDDLIYGGTGNDQLYAGTGKQTVMGGIGDDTIWGGSGAQLLVGGQGQDMIYGGSGPQTLMGGVGNDTLSGGSGPQHLEGGDGNDVLLAGSGNETLSGGTGLNTFTFSTASGQDNITNFHTGRDIIEIAFGFGGLKLVQPKDLVAHVSADAHGGAVLTVGSDFRLVLQHVTAASVEAHPTEFFKLA